jgi:hypothetical protein
MSNKDNSFSKQSMSFIVGLMCGLSICALLIIIDAVPFLGELVKEYQIVIAALIAFVIAMSNRLIVKE